MSAFCLSSLDDEIMSCWLLASGSDDLALLIRVPSSCGAARFAISWNGAVGKTACVVFDAEGNLGLYVRFVAVAVDQ